MASTVTRSNPSALADVLRATQQLARVEIHTGWASYMGASGDVLKRAAINTFGAPGANIPARDALTPTMAAMADEIREAKAEAFVAVLNGENPMPALEQLADKLGQELRSTVDNFSTPANAPSTVATKSRNDPLVDTGAMRDQAASKVIVR